MFIIAKKNKVHEIISNNTLKYNYYYDKRMIMHNRDRLMFTFSRLRVLVARNTIFTPRHLLYLFVQANCGQDGRHHIVRIAVRAGTTILKVAFAVIGNTTRNSNGACTIGNSGTKVLDVACFVVTGQPSCVVLALFGIVGLDVTCMGFRELLDSCFNVPV